ncbi:MAG TPA: hypothetical protein VE487_09955, partial [Ilumatobacter sp.]|nr:hypothetical protein [Ilumatobacter sp.]
MNEGETVKPAANPRARARQHDEAALDELRQAFGVPPDTPASADEADALDDTDGADALDDTDAATAAVDLADSAPMRSAVEREPTAPPATP